MTSTKVIITSLLGEKKEMRTKVRDPNIVADTMSIV